jgi:hypothetical protein
VDDGNVTHHEPARKDKHDVLPGPGSEGRGDTQRAQGSEEGPRARREGQIVRQPQSGRWGQRRGVGDEYRGASSGASQKRSQRGLAEGLEGAKEGVRRKRKGGSTVVLTPAQATTRRQLVMTKSWRDVRCRARQVQVRG